MKNWIIVSLMVASAGCSADTFISLDGGDPGDAQGDALGDAQSSGDGSMTGDADAGGVSVPDGTDSSFVDVALDVIHIDAASADAADGDGAILCSSVDVGTCAHSMCVTGSALVSHCDPSDEVAIVCVYDGTCCTASWTAVCVTYAQSVEPSCASCL